MQDIEQFSIEPGAGLGDLKFGLSTEAVHSHLGGPDESEFMDAETRDVAIWYYERLRLQIIFEKLDCGQHCATQFTTSYPSATLWGLNVVGRTEDEVLTLF